MSAFRAICMTGYDRLTSVSTLFPAYCGSFDRRAARFATMSNISFNIAPSAATSDELLSNSVNKHKKFIHFVQYYGFYR